MKRPSSDRSTTGSLPSDELGDLCDSARPEGVPNAEASLAADPQTVSAGGVAAMEGKRQYPYWYSTIPRHTPMGM